ncbi:MAG: hypothetical protein HC836_47505 [Richelia sp. RM2_1_2]|nr:hypothetical protein [Richelia sp. RM2_1_2]
MGTFEHEYINGSKYGKKTLKEAKKTVIKKRIVLKNSKNLKKLADEALKKDKEKYENRIIW